MLSPIENPAYWKSTGRMRKISELKSLRPSDKYAVTTGAELYAPDFATGPWQPLKSDLAYQTQD